jgi:hypothetical protein
VHGYIRASSVFTSESGEWKLGGFEVLSSMKDDDAIIYVRSLCVISDLIFNFAIEFRKSDSRCCSILSAGSHQSGLGGDQESPHTFNRCILVRNSCV